jgi:hypothetical protein
MIFKGMEIILGKMGSGKTLYMTLFAKEYSKLNPDSKIYSNYNIKLPNVIKSDFMFLPIESLRNCLILADDFYNLKTMSFFIMIIASMSRKLNISLLITAQRFTMVSKTLRELSDYEVNCFYNSEKDELSIVKIDINNTSELYILQNAVKLAKPLYDTNETVCLPIPSILEKEILKWSKSKLDLETNICFFTANSQKRQSLYKKLLPKLKS